jgi:hypothetical protein
MTFLKIPTQMFLSLNILLLALALPAHGKVRQEVYFGEAKKSGKLVYREKHLLTFDRQNKLLTAQTDYENPDGEKIVELKSDFSESLTAPSHEIIDFRTGERQGLRREDSALILFTTDRNGKEKTKRLPEVKNWFIALFSPTLRVSYDRKKNRILSYEGISNIKDEKGKNQNVRIDYIYPET